MSLLLPTYVLRRLSWESEGETDIRPVVGNAITVPTCKLMVKWDSEIFVVEAAEIESDSTIPIVGMQMCRDHKITIDMKPDGEVRIERI